MTRTMMIVTESPVLFVLLGGCYLCPVSNPKQRYKKCLTACIFVTRRIPFTTKSKRKSPLVHEIEGHNSN